MKKLNPSKFIAITAATLILSACNNTGTKDLDSSRFAINDPYENMNRKVFDFNVIADKHVIHPIVSGYRAIAPAPARKGIQNVLRNLRSPVDFVNQILQLDFDGAGTVLTRASINSTLGLGGLIDLAAHEGIKYEFEDFGQTLAVWGVPHGPYFMLPLIGPSSMRDYSGYITDSFMDPVRFYAFNNDKDALYYTKFGMDYLTIRDSLKDVQIDLEQSSIDYYAALRSIYYQRRAAMVKDLNPEDNAAAEFVIPDYEDDEYESDY